jgi:ATP diphosphatase
MNIFDQLTASEHDAANFGFKWETAQQIKAQILSEVAEIDVHLQDNDRCKLQEELGDLLHAVFSLAVFCGFDAEETLTKSVDKFERRLRGVKALAIEDGHATLNGKSFEELMQYWDKAKNLS